MRVTLLKRSSTKAERRFYEILKRNHIPFRFREKVCGREIDFLIGNIAVEIGNHSQDIAKNKRVIEAGYSMLFFSNREIAEDIATVEKHLLNNWLQYGKSIKSNTC